MVSRTGALAFTNTTQRGGIVCLCITITPIGDDLDIPVLFLFLLLSIHSVPRPLSNCIHDSLM